MWGTDAVCWPQEAPIALLRMPRMPSEMGKSGEGVGSRCGRWRETLDFTQDGPLYSKVELGPKLKSH